MGSARVFDPSRFLPGAPPPDRFAYLPFGIGPRVCIGAQFALTEAILVLATLIQAFRIERGDDIPVVPRAVVATQPDQPPPPAAPRLSAILALGGDSRFTGNDPGNGMEERGFLEILYY